MLWLQGPRASRRRGSVGRLPPRPVAVSRSRPAGAPLRVAMLAPPWISVPPPGYGGVESVVGVLTDALVRRGHAVTLFCAPGSRSSARVVPLLEESHPEEIERSLYEVDHVARAFEEIDLAAYEEPFDVVHDHCGFTALAMADRLDTPLVHTLHGQFTASTAAFYARHGHKAALVGISRAQLASAPAGLEPVGAIPNPIDARAWPLREHKDDYLLWIGRMTAEKGPHRAIAAARCRGRAACPGRRHPARSAGVLRPRGRAAHRRRACPLHRRDRWVGQARGCSRAPALCSCRSAGRSPSGWSWSRRWRAGPR